LDGVLLSVLLVFVGVIFGWWLVRTYRTVRTLRNVVGAVRGPDIFGGFTPNETARLMREVQVVAPTQAGGPTLTPQTSGEITAASRRIYLVAIHNLQNELGATAMSEADRRFSDKLSLLEKHLDTLIKDRVE
jgi:hypothetical protein